MLPYSAIGSYHQGAIFFLWDRVLLCSLSGFELTVWTTWTHRDLPASTSLSPECRGMSNTTSGQGPSFVDSFAQQCSYPSSSVPIGNWIHCSNSQWCELSSTCLVGWQDSMRKGSHQQSEYLSLEWEGWGWRLVLNMLLNLKAVLQTLPRIFLTQYQTSM